MLFNRVSTQDPFSFLLLRFLFKKNEINSISFFRNELTSEYRIFVASPLRFPVVGFVAARDYSFYSKRQEARNLERFKHGARLRATPVNRSKTRKTDGNRKVDIVTKRQRQ